MRRYLLDARRPQIRGINQDGRRTMPSPYLSPLWLVVGRLNASNVELMTVRREAWREEEEALPEDEEEKREVRDWRNGMVRMRCGCGKVLKLIVNVINISSDSGAGAMLWGRWWERARGARRCLLFYRSSRHAVRPHAAQAHEHSHENSELEGPHRSEADIKLLEKRSRLLSSA